jgi:hypothetical protein
MDRCNATASETKHEPKRTSRSDESFGVRQLYSDATDANFFLPFISHTQEIHMKAIIRSAVAIALTVAAGTTFAQQSKSEVSVDNVIATNAAVLGSKANQTLEMGNASGGGQSSVKGKNVIMTNAAVLGSTANQTSKIGNAEGAGSKSTVKFDNLIQTNAAVLGSKATQNLELGNAADGGQATLTAKNIIVTNAAVLGSTSKQDIKLGNAK